MDRTIRRRLLVTTLVVHAVGVAVVLWLRSVPLWESEGAPIVMVFFSVALPAVVQPTVGPDHDPVLSVRVVDAGTTGQQFRAAGIAVVVGAGLLAVTAPVGLAAGFGARAWGVVGVHAVLSGTVYGGYAAGPPESDQRPRAG